MNLQDLNKIDRILQEAYSELEEQTLKSNINIFSEEYAIVKDKLKEKILNELGFSVKEYDDAKNQDMLMLKKSIQDGLIEKQSQIDELKKQYVPTKEDILKMANEAAQTYVKPPQIINKIIKEVVIEKPTIVKETTVEKITNNIPYDDTLLNKKVDDVAEAFANLKFPEPIEELKLKDDMKNFFSENFKKNIDVLGMPDFRKLAMGIQQQVDERLVKTLVAGANIIITQGANGAWTITSTGGGAGSGFQLPTSGGVDGSNQTYTWAIPPKAICVDGMVYQQTDNNSVTTFWTGTLTTTFVLLTPNYNCFAIA